MTIQELAQQIDGNQYRNEFPNGETDIAHEHGYLLVYGCSDDLIEFAGFFNDEDYCDEGHVSLVGESGLILKPIQDEMDEESFESEFAQYLEDKKNAVKITANWSPENEDGNIIASWTYDTEATHATFKIMEDEDVYCIGLVIDMNN